MAAASVNKVQSFSEFICDLCSEKFSTSFLLAEHENLHNNVKPFLCPSCAEAFAVLEDYVKHYTETTCCLFFRCSYCYEVFKTQAALDGHKCPVPLVGEPLQVSCEGTKAGQEVRSDPKRLSTKPNKARAVHAPRKRTTPRQAKELCFTQEPFNEISPDNFSSKTDKGTMCTGCGKSFTTEKQLQNHLRLFPDNHYFDCKSCKRVFTSTTQLSKHLCVPTASETPIICSCLQVLKNTSAFKDHVGSKPFRCCCCNMTFNFITNLVKHVRTHTKQKTYMCDHCGKCFAQASGLRNHLPLHLQESNLVKCDLCEFTCKTPSGLFKHKKKHIGGKEVVDLRKVPKSHECLKCGKKFGFKRNLAMHVKSHEEGDYHLCHDCGKLFTSKNKLSQHKRNSHGENCICPTCGKMFAGPVLLKAHLKIHVAEKDFTCDLCFKKFALRSYLLYHIKTHDEKKRFKCNDCGKSFKAEISLKYHTKVSCQNVLKS